MTGIGVGVIILARVCSTANLLNSSTVAPPLRLSNTTTIPVQIKESNRSVMHQPILLLPKEDQRGISKVSVIPYL